MFTLSVCSTVEAQHNGEDSLSLNNSWYFKTDPDNDGEEKAWYTSNFNNAGWEIMQVPSNWDTHNAYADYAGKAWYRKTIQVPEQWKGKLVRLLFEAVYHDSKIWLNNKLLGVSNSGFLPFEFDVSALLNYGGNNTVVVCADNSFRRGAIWNWGGIRRPVFMVASEPLRVVNQFISPEVDLEKGTADITVKAVLENKDKVTKNIRGEIVISSKEGVRQALPFSKTIAPGKKEEVLMTTSLAKKQVHLWSFDDPFLYQCDIIIRDDNKVLHKRNDRFGLRKIEIDNANYIFKLNGQSIRPMGFNLVPDDRTTGNTLPLWRIKEDIDLLKSLGANMARLTHLPLPKEALDYLDEKGIMIFDEVPLWGFDPLADKNKQLPKEWLQQLMERDYNHASVIGWSVGNEIGQYPRTMEYVEDAINYVHQQDSIHLAVMVSHTADRGKDPLDFSDLGLVNKYGTAIGSLADKMHQLHPDKILFYSEYGYGQLTEDINADVNAKAMVDSMRFKPYLIGGSLWTFNDYRSSYIGTKEASENRPWGIVDVFRQKKKAYYSFRKEYAPIRELQVKQLKTGPSSSATVVLTPRQQLDLPAYSIKGYWLVWKLLDAEHKIVDGGFVKLPLIKPGDNDLSRTLQWKGRNDIVALSIDLVSPLSYSVYDTVINLEKPAMPRIVYMQGIRTDMNNLSPNSGTIRLVFAKDPLVKAYKAKYGKNDVTTETPETVNHFIDIPKLDVHDTYQVQFVAVNDAGETSAAVQKITIGYGTSAPVIYYTEPADSGFFVGYASQPDDYLYRVQYTTTKGDYTEAKTIQTATKGVLFVPNLVNGKTYYFRLQRVKQNSFESEWSEELSIVPDGGQRPQPPIVRGLLVEGNDALLCFEPVKKATAYLVQYQLGTGSWKERILDQAHISHVRIEGVGKHKKLACRIATLNENGQSEFSESVTSSQASR